MYYNDDEIIDEEDMCLYQDDYDNSNDHFEELSIEEDDILKKLSSSVYDKPGNSNSKKYNHYFQCISTCHDYTVAMVNIINNNSHSSNRHVLCIWSHHHHHHHHHHHSISNTKSSKEYLSLDKAIYTTLNDSKSIDIGLNNDDDDERSRRYNDIKISILNESILVVVGVINNIIKKWYFNINDNNMISFHSFLSTNTLCNVTITNISYNGRIASSESNNIVIRSDELRCIRSFNPLHSNAKNVKSDARITGISFLDNIGDKIIVCYSIGLVIGYDIISNTIIFEYYNDTNDELLNMIVFNDFIDLNSDYCTSNKRNVIIGFHDGKLRHLEVNTDTNEINEIQSVDLQKSMRYALKKSDNDVTYQDIQNDKTATATVTKLSNQIAIPLGLCLINPSCISNNHKESMMIINECRISVATSSAIIILTLNPFKVIASFPVDGPDKNFCASSLQYVGIDQTSTRKGGNSSSGLYNDMEYDDEEDLIHNKVNGHLNVTMISSFSGKALLLRYPFLKDSTFPNTTKKSNKPEGSSRSRLPLREIKSKAAPQDSKKLEVSTSRYIDNPNLPLSFFAHQCSEDEGKSLLNTKVVAAETPIIHRGATANKVYLKGGNWEKPGKDKKGKIIDQPVTFHKVIKSSGYGQVPNNILDKKRLERQRRLQREATEKQRSSSAAASLGSGKRLRQYPVNCDLICNHQEDHDLPSSRSIPFPISQINFSDDASMLGVAITDTSVLTLKMPVSKYLGEGISYMGHNKRVTNVSFSHDNQMILSSSADGTARIWTSGKTDSSAVVFSHYSKQPSTLIGKGGISDDRNKPFNEEIRDSSFYYLDKFVALSCSNSIMLYTYEPEGTEAKNDLKRLQSNGKYKCVHKWSLECQSFSTFSCINIVKSPFLLAASSDYKLMVLDTEVGGIARSIESPHEKQINSIALPSPSPFAQVGSESYNYFATAASDSAVNIWDIRVPRSTGRYTSHINRRETIQCCLSPCLRYLAVGSEDKTARIVDLRSGRELAKLQGFKDVVSSVSFHPLLPQLAAGSFDGQIKFFSC